MFLNQNSNFVLKAQLTNAAATSQAEISVSYRDNTGAYHPDAIVSTNDTTAVTLLAAPSGDLVNIVETIKIYNSDTQANTVEILAGNTVIYACTIGSKEALVLSEEAYGGVIPASSGSSSGSSCIQLGTCSTASATAEKTVLLSGFSLSTGATILVTFANANTTSTPTLNVNSTGAVSIADEGGTAASSNNPFYVPAGATVEFVYNGTYWIYRNRIVTSYVNGVSGYRIWTNGLKEQWGRLTSAGIVSVVTVTLPLAFLNTNYNLQVTYSCNYDAAVWGVSTAIYRSSVTSTTFQIKDNSSTYIEYYNWSACGY